VLLTLACHEQVEDHAEHRDDNGEDADEAQQYTQVGALLSSGQEP
jgi:hypothetical protein